MKKIRKVIPMIAKTRWDKESKCGGQFNGYLAIPIEIWNKIKQGKNSNNYSFIQEYDKVPDIKVYPNGGWTFGKRFQYFNIDDNFIPLLDVRKLDTNDYMVIGFDTGHISDNWNDWTAKAVRNHTFELYDALIEYIKSI